MPQEPQNERPETLRFGTVGSPQTTPESGTVAAIKHTKELGLSHLEIAWVRSVNATPKTCAEIKAAAEEHGITLSVHAPYFTNLNSQTEALMRNSDERLLQAARIGWLAGAKDVVFHPGSYHEQPPEEVYPIIRDKLAEIRRKLDDEGVGITLRPETMGKVAVFGTLEENLRLSQDIPNILPCIDWAHLHARAGDGSFNTYEEFAAALELVRAMAGEDGLKRLHCHISGIEYNAKGERKHIPLNTADLNYPDIIRAWIDYGVAGVIAVEAPEPFHVADCLTLQATYRYFLNDEEAKRNL